MAYRLPSERIAIDIDEITVEVERCGVWAIAANATRLLAPIVGDAPKPADLAALYAFFVAEAQPTWQIVDHRGPVPYTVEGCWRLPLEVMQSLILAWAGTIAPPETAVDKLIPPSPLRDELNRRLKAKKKAA